MLEAIEERRSARERRADRRAGLIAAVIANRGRQKGERRYRISDFIRDNAAGSLAPTPEERKALEHRMAPTKSIRS